ncbi:hypothetical protein CHUAL_004405 [Chamberlinius hualienensis]
MLFLNYKKNACPLIFASSPSDTCQHMLFTANAHFPTTMTLSTSATENFISKTCSQQTALKIATSTLHTSDARMISSSFESLADMANANVQRLIGSGLDHFKATQPLNFFDQDYYLY